MGRIAERESDKHLYAFVTSSKHTVMGGWAPVGALCGKKSGRVSISRYRKGAVTATARVNI